jgi:ABC-2 type transport system permease protein
MFLSVSLETPSVHNSFKKINMENIIPSTSNVLSALLRADFLTQWRNRRAVIMVILVPVIILISWKGLIDKFGGAFALSNCITVGLTAIGLMGYSNAIARDRDKGVFQRLRVAPVPAWSIMVSRLMVQLALIVIMITAVFLAGYNYDKISLGTSGYILSALAAFVGGAMYLGLGQAIVGLISNPETVNSTTRLVYFFFIMIGMFGSFGALGDEFGKIVRWSPYGTVMHILSSGMHPENWNGEASMALMVTIGYAILFSGMGIKNFKWNTAK